MSDSPPRKHFSLSNFLGHIKHDHVHVPISENEGLGLRTGSGSIGHHTAVDLQRTPSKRPSLINWLERISLTKEPSALSPPGSPHRPSTTPLEESSNKDRYFTNRIFSVKPGYATPAASVPSSPRLSPHPLPNSTKITKLIRCDVLMNGKIIRDETLWIAGNKFVNAESLFFQGFQPDVIVDFGDDKDPGRKRPLIVPGFIDLQINGYFGHDFADTHNLEAGLTEVAKGLLQYGVTSFLPTVVTSLPETYANVLPIIASQRGPKKGQAEILGAHCEGPFLNPAKKGAHNVDYIRAPKQGFTDILECYGPSIDTPADEDAKKNGVIKIITLAPENEGALEAIREIKKRWGDEIVVSLGHMEATFEDTENAVESGATMLTHLFNAMPPFHHRNPGPMGVLGFHHLPHETKKPFYGLITDGIHSSPSSVRVAYKAHPEGAVLVTDAMAGAGLEGDEFMLGSMHVTRKGPMEVVITGTDTLAGSVATMPFCITNLVEFSGCTLAEAVNAATIAPAKCIGVYPQKGSLMEGSDADFVVLDGLDDLDEGVFTVTRVFVAGEEVWRK